MGDHLILRELDYGKIQNLSLPCVIGRGNGVDLSMGDPAISHQHALIEAIDGRMWIHDLKSANGVFLNDQRIEGKAVLKPGDSIQLGQTRFRVCEAEEDLSNETLLLQAFPRDDACHLDQKRLKLIYEITTELSVNQEMTHLGEKLFSKFKGIFNQDRGYLALFQEDGSLKPLFYDPSSGSVPLSKSILSRLFQTGESFLLEDALHQDSFREQESILALKIRSAVCVPLIYHQQIYGLIYLDRAIPGFYKQDDLEFLRSVSSILAPLIENARLWTELKRHYDNAIETLRETEARLIDMERQAAYVRLAQAMAHEIRNPLMVIGATARRMAKSETSGAEENRFQAILSSVERVEAVLREVDHFVNILPPQKKLERIDLLIEQEIGTHRGEWAEKGFRPSFSVKTPQVLVPLDSNLFRKAISMVFQEILFSVLKDTEFPITVQNYGNEIEILFGTPEDKGRFCDPFDPGSVEKPWTLGLFLSMAHKIVDDHGGQMLLDSKARGPFPMIVRLPRTMRA